MAESGRVESEAPRRQKQPPPPPPAHYTWNAFSVVQNEEAHIRDVIESIKAQDSPPSRILVANHRSTDGTGRILDSIDGIEVSHYKPDPEQAYLPREYFEIRNGLFEEAIGGADYVMCVDGDTVVPSSYTSDIVGRMRRDGAVIACGQDPDNKVTLVVESPSVVDVKWLTEFRHPARTSSMNTSALLVHASLTGFRTAVYTDVPVKYRRRIGGNSSNEIIRGHGGQLRQKGFSLWYVLIMAAKRRNPHYVTGYIAAKGASEDGEVTLWWKRYQREKVFGRMSRCKLLKKTNTAIYVEPAAVP